MRAAIAILLFVIALEVYGTSQCDEQALAQEAHSLASEAFPDKQFVVLKPADELGSQESVSRFVETLRGTDLGLVLDTRATTFWLELLFMVRSHPDILKEIASYEIFIVGTPASRVEYEKVAEGSVLDIRYLEVESRSIDECAGG